jgi:hypothetical protein
MAVLLEVFAPLASRLYDFEINPQAQALNKDEYTALMDNVGRQLNSFPPQDVWDEATLFRERLMEILSKRIPPKPIDFSKINLNDYAEKSESEEREMFSGSELGYYFYSLEKIQEINIEQIKLRKYIVGEKIEKTVVRETVIQLPENFTVKQFAGKFEQRLSLKQTALLLNYLMSAGIMPPYNSSHLGELAKAFFARNDKNIRESLSEIHSIKQNKDDLSALKEALVSMINEIEIDLKKAR